MSFHTLLVFGLTYHSLSNPAAPPSLVKTSAAVAAGKSVTSTTAVESGMSAPVKPVKTSVPESHFPVITNISVDSGLCVGDPVSSTIPVELSSSTPPNLVKSSVSESVESMSAPAPRYLSSTSANLVYLLA